MFPGRQAAQRGKGSGQVLDQLLGGGRGDADLVGSQRRAVMPDRSSPQLRSRAPSADATRRRKFVAAARCLAEPERDGGRLAARVLDPHDATLDAHDAVGGVAKLEHVAGQALDGEVLVDAADRLVLGFQQHLVIGVVGDRAAGGQRGEPRTAPAAQHVVDRVVVNKSASPAAAGGKTLRQHFYHGSEVLAGQGRDTARRDGTVRRVPPRASPAPPPRRRSAAPAHPAGVPGWSAGRVRRGARCRAMPRIPPGRRATAGTAGPSACHRPHAPSVRRVAGSWR